jgi:hypothetical protein
MRLSSASAGACSSAQEATNSWLNCAFSPVCVLVTRQYSAVQPGTVGSDLDGCSSM